MHGKPSMVLKAYPEVLYTIAMTIIHPHWLIRHIWKAEAVDSNIPSVELTIRIMTCPINVSKVTSFGLKPIESECNPVSVSNLFFSESHYSMNISCHIVWIEEHSNLPKIISIRPWTRRKKILTLKIYGCLLILQKRCDQLWKLYYHSYVPFLSRMTYMSNPG